MEDNKDKTIKAQDVMLYTKTELFEDIQTTPEECVKDTPEGERARRNFVHKLKVLQIIFGMKLPLYDYAK